jgi:hypothetical protein
VCVCVLYGTVHVHIYAGKVCTTSTYVPGIVDYSIVGENPTLLRAIARLVLYSNSRLEDERNKYIYIINVVYYVHFSIVRRGCSGPIFMTLRGQHVNVRK